MRGLDLGRWGFGVGGVLLGLLGAGTAAHGAVLVSDNFDSVASGANLNGRTPNATVNAAKWVSSTADFFGNGSGSINADSRLTRSGFVDVGSYLSSNPGLYELSLDINQPSTLPSDTSWIGFGFAQGSTALGGAPDVSQQLVTNNGAPWMLFRLNGQVITFAGPANTNQANATTATLGSTHSFKLQLDTSTSNWTVNAFLDGGQLDLNGSTAGNTYTYAAGSNPTASHLIGIATAQNVNMVGAVGTVDNFVLTGPVPAPEPGTIGLLGAAGVGLLARRRRR